MPRHQVALVRVSRAEALHTVGALVRGLTRVPPPVLLVMRRMPELAVAIRAGESGQIGMDEHVIIQTMLPCENGTAPTTLVWLDSYYPNYITINNYNHN